MPSLCLRAYNPRGLVEVRQALENVNKVEDLLPIMKVRREVHRTNFIWVFVLSLFSIWKKISDSRPVSLHSHPDYPSVTDSVDGSF